MLRALALATLPLVAGYTPVRPLPHSVVAQGRLRTLSSRMAADYSGLSYRELQQACKAQGLKATGKADLLRERLAGQADEPAGAPPAGAARLALGHQTLPRKISERRHWFKNVTQCFS